MFQLSRLWCYAFKYANRDLLGVEICRVFCLNYFIKKILLTLRMGFVQTSLANFIHPTRRYARNLILMQCARAFFFSAQTSPWYTRKLFRRVSTLLRGAPHVRFSGHFKWQQRGQTRRFFISLWDHKRTGEFSTTEFKITYEWIGQCQKAVTASSIYLRYRSSY